MTENILSGLNRAAVLLMCLGEEATAKVFQELSDDEIHLISKTMSGINHIPLTVKNRVLQQYHDAQQGLAGFFFKGNDFAKKSITATNSGERTESLLHQHIADTESKSFASISTMKPQMVADILTKEHPQTTALVLSTQDADHSAAIISYLPESLHSEIVYRIAKLENVSLEVLSNLEKNLEKEIGQTIAEKQKDIGGFDRAVDLLSRMENDLNNAILEKLDDTDRQLAGSMRKKMFTFESLLNLDDRILQLILREINNDSLALALKTASDKLKNKIFSNMSSRAAEMIQEDIEALGPVRLTEIEAMQQSIVKTAMRLNEEGSHKNENGYKNVVL